MKLAIVLFNLGGPDSLEAVEPFLRNLFGDRAIISLPWVLRKPLAWWLAKRRAPVTQSIYAKIGGRSPILAETQAQAEALDSLLKGLGMDVRSFVAMRCWHPFSGETACEVKRWAPDKIVLLPLYPQFSTTTSGSSLDDWKQSALRAGVTASSVEICCYPDNAGFVAAEAALIQETLIAARNDVHYRLLLSAHGLPKRIVAKGDPYQWQVERTAAAIVERLGIADLDWNVCYQSRVGRLEWIGPATDVEIRRAGVEGKGVIVAPIAFVSEHSETLVELDIDYLHLAMSCGVVDYLRVPTVGTHPKFIAGLGEMVTRAVGAAGIVSGADGRLCPKTLRACPCPEKRHADVPV